MISNALDNVRQSLNNHLDSQLREHFEEVLLALPEENREFYRNLYDEWEQQEKTQRNLREAYIDRVLTERTHAEVVAAFETNDFSYRPSKTMVAETMSEADQIYPRMEFSEWLNTKYSDPKYASKEKARERAWHDLKNKRRTQRGGKWKAF